MDNSHVRTHVTLRHALTFSQAVDLIPHMTKARKCSQIITTFIISNIKKVEINFRFALDTVYQ